METKDEIRNGSGNGREDIRLLYQTLNLEGTFSTSLTNNLSLLDKKLNPKLSYVIAGVSNGFNIMPAKTGSKQPVWLGADASTYKASLEELTRVYLRHPDYGYGVLAGKQLGNFYFICIDIDIDTEECKERISKDIEELLNKYEIKYYTEITKSKRIHYYILLDNTSSRIENISKLPYSGTCSKLKDGKETKGEIELFTKNKFVVVYDDKPFFIDKPLINDYKKFETFLDEYLSKFETEESKEIKEPKKEQTKETKELFSKIVEAYKIIRKYHIVNGWEIDKVFSAYCIREKISTEKAIEGFKAIYGSEYDEKTTLRILELTKKKDLNLLPSLGSVYYHINIALNSGAELEDLERQLLKKVLEDIASKGYSDYELPEYLKNVENVFLDYSKPQPGKKGGVYYKEGYFIERNINGIKKVFYIEITASKEKALYGSHTLKDIEEIGIKADIIRLIREGDTKAHEFMINDKIRFRPKLNHKTVDEIIHEISKAAVEYSYSFNTNLYKKYITKKLEEYIATNGEPKTCIFSKQTGWSDDLKFFYHYALNDEYHELHPDNLLYEYRKDVIKNPKEQHDKVKELLQEGKLLGLLIVASVSSILIKPFNIQPITIIISGNSGAGKTTSSLIATSLFYYSDEVLINTSSTQVGLELTISKLNSLPVLIDEGALAEKDDSLEKLVFKASSGKGRTRGKKNLTVDIKELKSNIFWTTERTDIDNLKRTGAFRRALNLVVKSWNDFTSLFRPEERINEKYSGCGVDHIQYLMEHMEDVRKTFEEEIKDFSSKYKEITPIALNLYSGLILLEKFYNARFDSLRKTINKVLDDAKTLFIENKENVVQIFKDFLIANTTSKFHMVNTNGVIGEKLSNNSDIWGEYDVKTQTYYILVRSFKEIAKELGKERNLLVEELVKAGVLKNKEGKTQWLKSIGQSVRVYIVNFGADKEETKTDSDAINNSVVDDEVVEF